MKEFHTEEYIDFLLRITPDNMHEMADRMKQHNVGFVGQYDCPVFDGIFPFCQVCQSISTGLLARQVFWGLRAVWGSAGCCMTQRDTAHAEGWCAQL